MRPVVRRGPGMYESGPFGEASGGPVQCHVAAGVVAQSHRGNIPVGTRLVHAFTALIGYLFWPYVVYRSRDVAAR